MNKGRDTKTMMTQRKFWCRALTGGFLSRLDWLAATMIAGIAGNAFDSHMVTEKRGRISDVRDRGPSE